VSVIDELPGGRGANQNICAHNGKTAKVFEFIRDKFSGGRQAFIVYPRIEVTDKDIKAVTKEFKMCSARSRHSNWLLHGRMEVLKKKT